MGQLELFREEQLVLVFQVVQTGEQRSDLMGGAMRYQQVPAAAMASLTVAGFGLLHEKRAGLVPLPLEELFHTLAGRAGHFVGGGTGRCGIQHTRRGT